MKIALFDHIVSPRSPAGSCDLRVLAALDDEHEITVFTSELAIPVRSRAKVEHVSLPSVRRPALASFLVYFARACLAYAGVRLAGTRFDVVQATDCGFAAADVCYAHFCHRAYLADVWPALRTPITPRKLHWWANHVLRARLESRLMRRARVIVVPSDGLRRDLARVYPGVERKITVIRNTVDLDQFARPVEFDRRPVREQLQTSETHTAYVFVALGHFERKGLPALLEALAVDYPPLDAARLWVVGGEPGLVASYRALADRLGVADKAKFVGRVADVRPFLWSADTFVAPSHYEAFSLGLLEAAAAGLPLIATRISGSEELLEDGVNGFVVRPTAESIRSAMQRFGELDGERREGVGRAARESVEPLAPERFTAAWRTLYASLER